MLGNVYKLDLSWCNNITDVSALENVHTLNLEHCENITNFSAFKNFHNLNWCKDITNVFKNVRLINK